MKFTIQQADLQKALGLVANVVPGKTTMPILTCVLFEADADRLTLSATNLDMSVTTGTADVNVKEPGRIAVPAAKVGSSLTGRSIAPFSPRTSTSIPSARPRPAASRGWRCTAAAGMRLASDGLIRTRTPSSYSTRPRCRASRPMLVTLSS